MNGAPSVPRSRIVGGEPSVHKNGWYWPLEVRLGPVTCPLSFTSYAALLAPPSVPMSTIPPDLVHEKA